MTSTLKRLYNSNKGIQRTECIRRWKCQSKGKNKLFFYLQYEWTHWRQSCSIIEFTIWTSYLSFVWKICFSFSLHLLIIYRWKIKIAKNHLIWQASWKQGLTFRVKKKVGPSHVQTHQGKNPRSKLPNIWATFLGLKDLAHLVRLLCRAGLSRRKARLKRQVYKIWYFLMRKRFFVNPWTTPNFINL